MKTIPVSETDRSGRKRCGFFGFGKHIRCLNLTSRHGPIFLDHSATNRRPNSETLFQASWQQCWPTEAMVFPVQLGFSQAWSKIVKQGNSPLLQGQIAVLARIFRNWLPPTTLRACSKSSKPTEAQRKLKQLAEILLSCEACCIIDRIRPNRDATASV